MALIRCCGMAGLPDVATGRFGFTVYRIRYTKFAAGCKKKGTAHVAARHEVDLMMRSFPKGRRNRSRNSNITDVIRSKPIFRQSDAV